jgi:urease subunit gamma/beta
MRLIPWEEERLQVFAAAELARRRRAAGPALNHPEAVAIICDTMLEAARAGASYAAVEDAGRTAVEPTEVLGVLHPGYLPRSYPLDWTLVRLHGG